MKSIEAGACGYVWKGDLKNLKEIFEIVCAGGAVLSPAVAVRLMQSMRKRLPAQSLPDLLTPREIQVFQSIAEGMTARQAGALLGTTESTVRNQIKSIYRKLELKNRVDLMKIAARYGLVRAD